MTDDSQDRFAQAAAAPGRAGNERMAAFSDGVFAIAITLLVLELQVPASVPPGGLIALVPEFLPKLAGHVITFAILGIYWVGHHNMFMHIKRHDRTLLWLNNLFLLFVAAMPFPAGLIVQYGNDQAGGDRLRRHAGAGRTEPGSDLAVCDAQSPARDAGHGPGADRLRASAGPVGAGDLPAGDRRVLRQHRRRQRCSFWSSRLRISCRIRWITTITGNSRRRQPNTRDPLNTE